MSIFQKISQYANYRRTVRQLNGLDDVQLKDLGITRFDIKAIARANAF